MSVRSLVVRLATLACIAVLGSGLAVTAAEKKAPAKKPAAKKPAAPAPAPEPEPVPPAPEPAPVAGQPEAPKPPFLGYRWKSVSEAKFKVLFVGETTTTVKGKDPYIESVERETVIAVRPGPEEKGKTTLEIRFESLRFRAVPQNIVVDTSAAENPQAGPLQPMVDVFGRIKDRSIKITMNLRGTISKIEGVAELFQAARDAWPASPNRDQLVALVFPTQDVVNQFVQALLPLPAKYAEPGYAEPKKNQAGQEGQLLFEKVEEIDGRPVIFVRQDLAAKPLPPQFNQADQMSYVRDQFEQVSAVKIDRATLLPLNLATDITLKYSARKASTDPAGPADKLVQQLTKISTQLLAKADVAPADAAPSAAVPAAPQQPQASAAPAAEAATVAASTSR